MTDNPIQMNKYKGTIFLIPSFLSESNGKEMIAPQVIDIIKHTDYYLVENIRTARRYISKLQTSRVIEELTFFTLDKKTDLEEIKFYFREIPEGSQVGVISEAGCPGIADPGAKAVQYAHKNNYQVVSLPGPSSIFMALMGSGFSGQQFRFSGYLPINRGERAKSIKALEKESRKGETQIFMETPFRNNQLFEDLLSTLHPETLLSIASDITGSAEYIFTQKASEWKKVKVDLHKKPTIFLLGRN